MWGIGSLGWPPGVAERFAGNADCLGGLVGWLAGNVNWPAGHVVCQAGCEAWLSGAAACQWDRGNVDGLARNDWLTGSVA